MTTQTTSAWNPTLTQIVNDVLFITRQIQEGETPTADAQAVVVRRLNGVIKMLEATGIHVWTEEEAILFPQMNQYRYLIGGPTTDHTCSAWAWNLATLANNYATGATSIVWTNQTVTSGAPFTVTDNIGIGLDSGATFWTTITSVTGSTLGLASPLPSSASTGNFVFDYPAGGEITRPLMIPKARAFGYQGLNEIYMGVLARQQYMDYPNKQNPANGAFTQFFYTPQLVSGELYLWQCPSNAQWGCRFTWYRPLADLTTFSATADFPQEWIEPLTWLTARAMMTGFAVPEGTKKDIDANATAMMDLVSGWDRESEPMLFKLDTMPR